MRLPPSLALSLHAARANLIPGIALWIVAVLILLGYCFIPAVHALFMAVAEHKRRLGFFYSIPSTALFGGALPFLFIRLNPHTRNQATGPFFWFLIVYWGFKGADVDLLYRIQGAIFGNSADGWTVARKVLVDQFVYNPIWGAPLNALVFLWRGCGYDSRMTLARIRDGHLKKAILPILVSTWIVWLPAVSIVYSLPAPLQIPLFNIVLCFFMLILSVVTGGVADTRHA